MKLVTKLNLYCDLQKGHRRFSVLFLKNSQASQRNPSLRLSTLFKKRFRDKTLPVNFCEIL